MAYETEMPRQEDQAEFYETFAAGSTPTRTGSWIVELIVKPVDGSEA